MKIHDRGGFGPIGQPDPPKEPAAASRRSEFSLPATEKAPAPEPPAGATRADLDNPSRFNALLRAQIAQTLDASPLTADLTRTQREMLETRLASDPMMRDLVTRFLEGTIR